MEELLNLGAQFPSDLEGQIDAGGIAAALNRDDRLAQHTHLGCQLGLREFGKQPGAFHFWLWGCAHLSSCLVCLTLG